jgi:hypothetical protein
MPKLSFDDFVRREQQAVRDQNATDWAAEKEAWIESLDSLFIQVSGYLREYVEAGQVSINYTEIELNEENIGSYAARKMFVTIGTKTVVLEPIGTLLVGSKGRVDVVGPLSKAQLLLLDSEARSVQELFRVSVSVGRATPPPRPPGPSKPIRWIWRIVTKPPRMEIIEITKDSFLSLLTELANG